MNEIVQIFIAFYAILDMFFYHYVRHKKRNQKLYFFSLSCYTDDCHERINV